MGSLVHDTMHNTINTTHRPNEVRKMFYLGNTPFISCTMNPSNQSNPKTTMNKTIVESIMFWFGIGRNSYKV